MKNIPPRKKRRKKKYRMATAKEWIKNYEGEDIVKVYAKWYGIDLMSAIQDLRVNGVPVEEAYEEKVKKASKAKKLARRKAKRYEKRKKKKLGSPNEFSDDKFAYIVGYTSGGAPFGVTHEEMKYALEDDGDYGTNNLDFDDLFNEQRQKKK